MRLNMYEDDSVVWWVQTDVHLFNHRQAASPPAQKSVRQCNRAKKKAQYPA